MKKNFGITLIELLAIVGILAILTVMAVPAFQLFRGESDLNESGEEIINVLRLAQNKTLASERGLNYGVHFEGDKFVLFEGTSYNPLAPDNDVHNLKGTLEIYEIDLAGGESEVVFERVVGTTSQFGSVSLKLKAEPSKSRTIYVESSGQVGLIFPSILSDENRIKDSRHVHFGYNTNAQDAITLRLIFPGYPADNYNIDFQTYLNADKTEFSWEGIVLVGSDGSKTEQRLKIHTHSLTIMVAQFCVHRPLSPDQSYNDKALNIFLDTEELIRYAADERGTTIKGLSIYVTQEPEWQ